MKTNLHRTRVPSTSHCLTHILTAKFGSALIMVDEVALDLAVRHIQIPVRLSDLFKAEKGLFEK